MKKRLLQGVFRVFVVSGYELNSRIKATRLTTLEFLERGVRSAFRRSNQFQVSTGCMIIIPYSGTRTARA
jgi:hypothetical protein